jgi:hypothetical protein
VSLPAATSIGNGAFAYCTSLEEVSLPAAESIGANAFSGCTSLEEAILLKATSIASSAFQNCTSLAAVSLPAAESIGNRAFFYCPLLAKVSLPVAESIGGEAFLGCTSLAELTLPATPPAVGSNMFIYIDTAQTVTVKVLAASVSAYDETWQNAFKGGNTNITLILQAQYDEVLVNVILWANEDGSILGSTQEDISISKTATGYPDSFTVTMAGAYTLVQWQVNGVPLGSLGNPLTIAAADYATGKTYILGALVTKDGVPYSTDFRFTVED